MRRALIDAEARRSISADLGSTLFVEAGAGSGKTTELVGRIVALIRGGHAEIGAIAAITFTEAAAAELRIRVREELSKIVAGAGNEDSEEARSRCAAALGRIDEAPISTIHGFCQRLLASHPIEAGLPPRIEVLDEIAGSLEWRARWSAELDYMAADAGVPELVALTWSLGVVPRRVEDLARAVDQEWHRCRAESPDVGATLAAARERAVGGLEALRSALDEAAAMCDWCLKDDDQLLAVLHSLGGTSTELGQLTDWREAVAFVASNPVKARTVGRATNWDVDVAEVRRLVEVAAKTSRDLLGDLFDLAVGTFTHYLEHRACAAAARRRRSGRLTFHDLLVLARDLLRASPGARVAIRHRYRYLLIDEFQDTDPLQLEIASLIGTDPMQEGGSGSQALEDGRCFFVGDPKQSIYRFRGADLEAYESARSHIVGSDVTRLTSNFRSVPAIIDFVNGAFESLLGDRFQRLDAARDPATLPVSSGPVRAVNVIGGELEKMLRTDQRRIESEDCCRAIERAVELERWTVYDPTDGGRPARLGDIAILVPRRTGLAELEAALDSHGIGFRVESASLIFKSQEVRDVLALARALDGSGDHAAIVAALRSPAYSIGDDELVAWATHGGSWSLDRLGSVCEDAVRAAPQVHAALVDLTALRSHLPELGAVGSLARAVRERRLLQVVADGPRARESWRRIRFLLDKARVFVEASGRGLADFADWVDEQVEGGLRASESIVPDADEDVVRIMTVHGAKGLEFPITVLCGFGTSDSANQYDTIQRRDGAPTEVRFTKELLTSGYGALDALARARDEEEAVRLLYVATTRARDYLVLCGHHVRSGTPTLGERLIEAAGTLPAPPRRLPSYLDDAEGASRVLPEGDPSPKLAAPAARPTQAVGAVTPVIGSLAEYEAWCDRREALLRRASTPASVRATEMGRLAAGAAGTAGEVVSISSYEPDAEESFAGSAGDDGEVPAIPGRGRRGRAGTQVGRAVHATLQSVSLEDAIALGASESGRHAGAAERLVTVAEVQAAAERVPERSAEVARLALAALRSPVVRRAFTSGTARREVYVSTTVGSLIVDGFVDLCFRDADGSLVVVDYKTDAVRDLVEAAERAASYELQIAAYALALGDATGWPVSRCVLVWLAPPAQPIEHEIAGGVLVDRMATVRQSVEALSP